MERHTAFIGCQNGDEGKGKIVDWYLGEAEREIAEESRQEELILGKEGQSRSKIDEELRILCYRWQGGANAGHTAIRDGVEHKLHMIPMGVLHPHAYNLIGTRTYINPRKTMQEIIGHREQGVKISKANLGISSRAHVTIDTHLEEDRINFEIERHTSTGNGIMQTGRDKYGRIGLRFAEFLDAKLMAEILIAKNPLYQCTLDANHLAYSYEEERGFLKQFLVNETDVFNDKKFKYVVSEGAQGMMLDIDDGQYPGVTSTSPGLPPHRPDEIIGVFKAYVSSVGVGERPLVTAMAKGMQEFLQVEWAERGTTTNRPRDIGWFDAVAGRYAVDTAHIDTIALTSIDKIPRMFTELGTQFVQIAVGYRIDGKEYGNWNEAFDRRDTLAKAQPIYESLPIWKTTYDDKGALHPNAKRYIERLQTLLGKQIRILGVGAKAEDILRLGGGNIWQAY